MPGSRTFRTFRAYFRAAGHISGQPDSRAYRTFRATGQPGIFPGNRAYFRAAGHTGQPNSRAYRTAGHISGQPGIFPGSRAYFRAAGQPDIPGNRASSEQEFKHNSEQWHNQADVPGNRTFFTHRAHVFFVNALMYLLGYIIERLYEPFLRMNSSQAAQHCLAADAAGAAPELGAIFWRGGTVPLISICGGRQRRR